MRSLLYCAAATIGLVASPLSAAEVVGDTTGGPTWNRPVGSGPFLSGTGTDVPYEATSFTVDTASSYAFAVTSAFDNYLFLYANSFDPNNPLSNLLIGNDDAGPGLDAAFDFGLSTGVSYFAVVSGFANDDFGSYTLSINGPGNVTIANGAVPEPTTWAMMLLGFGFIGGAMRSAKRRQKVTVSYA